MASKIETSNDCGPIREESSDFALLLKDGRELQCHKVKLSEVSPFFRAMFRQNCEETLTNKMKVKTFEPDTAESFLDFIYADLEDFPGQNLFKKKFEEERLTPDLLRMSHMYDVSMIQVNCVKHLKKSINDANVVDVWSAAETTGNESLKALALDHLGKKGEKMVDIPRMKEAYASPQMMESLVTYMSARLTQSSRFSWMNSPGYTPTSPSYTPISPGYTPTSPGYTPNYE